MIITYDEPGITYDDPRVTYDGVFTDASVWPAESTVSLGVQYGPNGVDFTGSAIAGNGATVIAYRSDVQITTPNLGVYSIKKHQDQQQERHLREMFRSNDGNTYTFSETASFGLSVITQINASLSVVEHKRILNVFSTIDYVSVTTKLSN